MAARSGERSLGERKIRTRSITRIAGAVAGVALVAICILNFSGAFKIASVPPSNALMIIAPYKYAGTWVFDDPAAGLTREPFVSGIPEMIDDMVKNIANSENGFRLLFSTQPFPGYTHHLKWLRGDKTGNWYFCEQTKKEGWLCPGLFKYYKDAPKVLYVKAEMK